MHIVCIRRSRRPRKTSKGRSRIDRVGGELGRAVRCSKVEGQADKTGRDITPANLT